MKNQKQSVSPFLCFIVFLSIACVYILGYHGDAKNANIFVKMRNIIICTLLLWWRH